MLAAVTGHPYTRAEVMTVARRVVNARKCVNQREGWTAAEDTLPARFLADAPETPGAPFLPRARLEAMIAAYYEARGWTPDGRVPERLRMELGLDDPAFGSLAGV
jgi:aldehyde:ferredoxin oxidoreductase